MLHCSSHSYNYDLTSGPLGPRQIINSRENNFGKVTSWPQLTSEFLVAHAC